MVYYSMSEPGFQTFGDTFFPQLTMMTKKCPLHLSSLTCELDPEILSNF